MPPLRGLASLGTSEGAPLLSGSGCGCLWLVPPRGPGRAEGGFAPRSWEPGGRAVHRPGARVSAGHSPWGPPTGPPPVGASLSYCSQMLSKEVDACVSELLRELVRFQDRTYQKDPVKAKTKRRLVLGLREVLKHLRLRKLKCVIISPNCEKIQSKGNARRAGSRSRHQGPRLPLTWPPGGRSRTQQGPGCSGWRSGRSIRPPGRWGAPGAPAVGLLPWGFCDRLRGRPAGVSLLGPGAQAACPGARLSHRPRQVGCVLWAQRLGWMTDRHRLCVGGTGRGEPVSWFFVRRGPREPSEHVCLSPTCVGSPRREPGWLLRGASLAAVAVLQPESGGFLPCVGSQGPESSGSGQALAPEWDSRGLRAPVLWLCGRRAPSLDPRTAPGLNRSPSLPPCPRPEIVGAWDVPQLCLGSSRLSAPTCGRPQGPPAGSCWAAAGLMPAGERVGAGGKAGASARLADGARSPVSRSPSSFLFSGSGCALPARGAL